MVSWRPFFGLARPRRALTVSLVQLSCTWYQPRGVSRALPWKFARTRSGSLTVARVRGGCPWSGASCRGPARPRQCVRGFGQAWLGGAVPDGPAGERWVVLGCHGCLWRGECCGGCSSGLRRWCLGGLWTEMGGVCGARSWLVDL